MITLDTFKRLPRAPQRSGGDLKTIHQQAVRQDALTGDENWDYFLAYLEHALQAAESARGVEAMKLCDPLLVNEQQILGCKIAIAQWDARITTLKEVMRLPKYLKANGEMARLQIADLSAPKNS